MAEINNPIVFGPACADLIAAKKIDVGFTHTSWSSDELKEMRSLIRNHYRIEQQGLCAYCRNPISIRSALNCHVEHIVPKSKYIDFIFEPKNLCVICADCNAIKRNQEVIGSVPDPLSNGATRKVYPRASSAFFIVHPHFDRWEDHIQIFGKYYVDKSEKGHFTIGACELNRHLREFGWEPALVDDASVSDAMTSYLNANSSVVKSSALLQLMRLLNQL